MRWGLVAWTNKTKGRIDELSHKNGCCPWEEDISKKAPPHFFTLIQYLAFCCMKDKSRECLLRMNEVELFTERVVSLLLKISRSDQLITEMLLAELLRAWSVNFLDWLMTVQNWDCYWETEKTNQQNCAILLTTLARNWWKLRYSAEDWVVHFKHI